MTDYERVARIIRYLDEVYLEQPGLDELACQVGLSSFQVQRLFSRWAGVSPKQFLQCVTNEHAKRLLRAGESVLDAGLSGPGRLHDLCVKLEAATPGELKSGGAGWMIRAGVSKSPFGQVQIAEGPRGICYLAFTDSGSLAEIQSDWPEAEIVRDDGRAADLAARIFQPGNGETQPLRAYVRGTSFQVRVWQALLEVPPGQLVSYGRLAKKIGRPTASRAVGAAVGRNDLAYLIPCHRVIRESGALGGYRWGTERKRAMIGWETSIRSRKPGDP